MDINLYKRTKFGAYLLSIGETAYDFQRRTGISLATIYKVLNGGKPRKDVARYIVKAAHSSLKMEDFGYVAKKTVSG